MRIVEKVLLVWLFLSTSGCLIGTWPTPEDTPRPEDEAPNGNGGGGGGGAIGPEACDGVDNDADGATDEGCDCDGEARGCFGSSDGVCGLGVQLCVDGTWQECGGDLGPPFADERVQSITVDEVTPAALVRGEAVLVTARFAVVTKCPGIVVPAVEVTLASTAPVMRVRATAKDDGVAPDASAGDGLYTARLPNAFGPGVPAQELTLRGEAVLDEDDTAGTAAVPLEEP